MAILIQGQHVLANTMHPVQYFIFYCELITIAQQLKLASIYLWGIITCRNKFRACWVSFDRRLLHLQYERNLLPSRRRQQSQCDAPSFENKDIKRFLIRLKTWGSNGYAFQFLVLLYNDHLEEATISDLRHAFHQSDLQNLFSSVLELLTSDILSFEVYRQVLGVALTVYVLDRSKKLLITLKYRNLIWGNYCWISGSSKTIIL